MTTTYAIIDGKAIWMVAANRGKGAREKRVLLQPMREDIRGTVATSVRMLLKYGAGYRDRTRDPLITNQVLYQLS